MALASRVITGSPCSRAVAATCVSDHPGKSPRRIAFQANKDARSAIVAEKSTTMYDWRNCSHTCAGSFDPAANSRATMAGTRSGGRSLRAFMRATAAGTLCSTSMRKLVSKTGKASRSSCGGFAPSPIRVPHLFDVVFARVKAPESEQRHGIAFWCQATNNDVAETLRRPFLGPQKTVRAFAQLDLLRHVYAYVRLL